MSTWYLGPLGDLRALECPEPDLNLTTVRYGGVHQSLSGARTMDVTGHRTDYTFQFNYLTQEEYSWLEALHSRLIPGPFRLINPLKANRVSLAASTLQAGNYLGAGVQLEPQLWSWDYSWPSEAGAGARSMKLADWTVPYAIRFDRKIRVPVFPSEQITWSIWLKATAAQSVTLSLDWWDRTAQISGTATSVANVTTTWTRFSVTGTAVAGALSAQPSIILPTDTGESVWMAAPQVETGATPTAWGLGGGAPEVLLDQIALTSHRYPLYTASMTLMEA